MLRNIFKCAEFVYRLALSHFHTLDCDFAATYATSEHTVAKLIILIGKKLHSIRMRKVDFCKIKFNGCVNRRQCFLDYAVGAVTSAC